tara:strand:- start:1236 stop:1367 length:132 start_codon:yes stop_codon:yes gene_type:complete
VAVVVVVLKQVAVVVQVHLEQMFQDTHTHKQHFLYQGLLVHTQ